MKKVVRVFAVVSLFTVSVYADKTITLVKCEDLKKGHREYGCVYVNQSEVRNEKFQCMQAMKSFDFLQDEITDARRRETRRHKPSIIPGKKAVIMGMAHGQLNISDSEKDYKLSKQKMEDEIKKKIGDSLEGKKYVSLLVKTPKGEAKVKVELKADQSGSGYSVESWEKDNSPEKADDILVALGQSDINTDMGSDEMANISTDNINNADQALEQQKQDVEAEYASKLVDINRNPTLGSLEKIAFRQALREKKEKKISELNALLAKVPHYKDEVREACSGERRIVKAASISGGASGASQETSSSVATR